MRRFTYLAAALATALSLWSPAASAGPRPASPLQARALTGVELVEFRFPWESRRAKSPKQRTKRPARSEKPRKQQPAPGKRGKGSPAAAPAAPQDPLDAKLPPASGPLGVASPRGETAREAQQWRDIAAQVAPPAAPPLIAAEGPAPAPANVVALLAPLRVIEATTSAPPPGLDEPETPDRHVPLPPIRPSAPGAAAPRTQGLAPEGQALAPEGVPLPPKRSDGAVAGLEPEEPPKPQPPPGPTAADIPLPVTSHEDDADCRALATEGVAEAAQIPPIEGPGVCVAGPLVSLTGMKRADGVEIKIHPAATLRCSMARALVSFLRDDVAPAAHEAGVELTKLEIAGSFQCRGRNGAAFGKMSEHARANAVDLSGFGFADGKSFGIFSAELPKAMADKVKSTACERFNTVLGPGSDGFHETHLHIDLQPRRSKAKICQWSDPEIAKAKPEDKQDAEGPKADKADKSDEGDDDRADDGKEDAAEHKAAGARRKAETRQDHKEGSAP